MTQPRDTADVIGSRGTAATVDTGTAAGQVPLNSDLRVDTIALLRLEEPTIDGQQIDLLGHTLAGIGGGKFYYDASDTTSADNNGTVIVTTGGKRWKRLGIDGKVYIDWFGAVRNDYSFDNSQPYIDATNFAVSISQQDGIASQDVTARVQVVFTGGNIYSFKDTTSALDTQAVRVNFISEGGQAIISGYDPLVPLTKNPLGFTFGRVYKTDFIGLSFVGFVGVHQWDTNNVDSALVRYIDCEFTDCSSDAVPAIDTVSYALSRSTRLVFDEARSSGTEYLCDSYCDQLHFKGGSHRNASTSNRYVKADSQVVVDGGIWTPYQVGDDARWFDLYDNAVSGSRGFIAQGGVRFGPESGGIPVVRNFMAGSTVAQNHLTNYIMFYGGYAPASPGSPQPQASVVQLADNGVNTYTPNLIGFYGASVRSRLGLVSTINSLPSLAKRGAFVIEVSMASQSFLTNYDASVTAPLVEDILRKYLVGAELYNEPTIITSANPLTIDLTSINAGFDPILQISGTGAVIDELSGAFDGQLVTLEFLSSNATVQDFSSGSRIFLNGSVDFVTQAFGTLSLRWHRAGNKWYEVGRCGR